MPSTQRVHEWELETLANEMLAQPLRRFGFGFPEPYVNCANYDTIARLTNLLREIENLEYAASGIHIYKELYRIAGRQFEWQRGFFNRTSLYRSAFLFGGPECGRRLKAKTGFTFDDLAFAGFGLYAVFIHYVQMERRLPMAHVGISDELGDATLELISSPIDEAHSTARSQRAGWEWTAYRPSILRQTPCISLRYSDELIIAPLPALILDRLTSGMFYDVVSEDGRVRNEIGHRFE